MSFMPRAVLLRDHAVPGVFIPAGHEGYLDDNETSTDVDSNREVTFLPDVGGEVRLPRNVVTLMESRR